MADARTGKTRGGPGIRNPWALPRSRPAQGELPELVDHTGDPCENCGRRHDVRFAEGRGLELSADNPFAWTVFYVSEYASGRADVWCRYQRVIVPAGPNARDKAILTLLTLRRGLCRRVHVLAVEPPATARQRAEVAELNRIVAKWGFTKSETP